MIGRGVVGALTIDWPSLMRFKRTFTDPIRTRQERRYADQGVDTFHGLARFKEHYASWIVFCFDRSGPNQSFRTHAVSSYGDRLGDGRSSMLAR